MAQQMKTKYGRIAFPERGVSLILVMLAMLVLSVLAATIVFTARSETLASYNFKLDTQADYLAKAGIQQTLNWLRSARYTAVPHNQASAYYAVSSTGAPYNYWTSNASPVQCISGCSTTSAPNNTVRLMGIPGTGSSNYPLSSVLTNFAADFPSSGLRISGTNNDSGLVFINAVLLNYRTVGVGTPPAVTPTAMETWLITSRAVWTGSSTATATVAVAEEQALVQPIYMPTWGNALYGYCSVSMNGSAGVCTDAFNSAFGAYGGGNVTVASKGCNNPTAANVIDAGAGVGANGGVSLGSNVTVSGNVTIGTNPSAGCTASGFTGNPSSVLGEVVTGPHVAPPAPPTFRSGFPTGAPNYSLGTGDVRIVPASVATWPSMPPFPNASYTPPLTAGGPCMDSTCTGTIDHPFEIDAISMSGGGKSGSAPILRLVGGPDVFHPVYYNVDDLSQTDGEIQVSGYVVINIKNSFSIGGIGISNGITSSIPPRSCPDPLCRNELSHH